MNIGILQHCLVVNTSANSILSKFITQSGATWQKSASWISLLTTPTGITTQDLEQNLYREVAE